MKIKTSLLVADILSIIAIVLNTYVAFLITMNGSFLVAVLFVYFGYLTVKSIEKRLTFRRENFYDIIIEEYISASLKDSASKRFIKAKNEFRRIQGQLSEGDLEAFNEKYKLYKEVIEAIYKTKGAGN